MATSEWSKENWYAEIVEFRNDSLLYLNTRQIDEESFAICICQALCDEALPTLAKVHLLGLLQEYADQLLPTVSSTEVTVASLLDIFKQSKQDGSHVFRTHILVAITNLLLLQNFQVEGERIFCEVVELLLDVVCQTNTGDRLLRSTACQCLHQIETHLPGVLIRKLEYMYELCQMEKSPACQHYFMMFTVTLSNTISILLKQQHSHPASQLRDLLCNRTEPLKPFHLPRSTLSYVECLEIEKDASLEEDSGELKRAVSFVMDHAYVFTSPALVHVCRQLAHIVAATPSISPSIFKWAVLRYSHTHELPLFHLVFHLKEQFGEELVTESDWEHVIECLLTSLSHPALPAGHRLLMYEWLTPLTQGKTTLDTKLPSFKDPQQYAVLFPRIFDGVDTQLKKAKVLSLAVRHMEDEDMISAVLLKSVWSIHKRVEYGVGDRVVQTLFKAIYIFLQMHHTQEALVYNIKRLLVDLVASQSIFTPHVLDFVEAIESTQGNASEIAIELLSALMDSLTTSKEVPSTGLDLQHYLIVLQRIAQESNVDTKKVIQYLTDLIHKTSLIGGGGWLLGNLILSVCRTLMQCHNTEKMFVDLGTVLHYMMTSYDDVDIRDRAKFYYGIVMTLSPEKVSALLVQTPANRKGSQGLAGLMSGNVNLPLIMPITHLQQPVLQLTRLSKDEKSAKKKVSFQKLDSDTSTAEFLVNYERHWKSSSSCKAIQMDFNVHFHEDCMDMEEVYALVLHFTTDHYYFPIQDVHVAYLKRGADTTSENNVHPVSILLRPKSPVPTSINIQGVFAGCEGRTYSCRLQPVEVGLEDICLPLPLPPSWASSLTSTLQRLLWQNFTTEAEDGETLGIESVFCLHITPSKVMYHFKTRWHQHIIYTGNLHDDGGEEQLCLAMFLPPCHHLLLKVKPQGQNTIVAIATDNYRLLPILSNYLKGLEEQEG